MCCSDLFFHASTFVWGFDAISNQLRSILTLQDDFDDLCEALTNCLGPASSSFHPPTSSALHVQNHNLLSPSTKATAPASASENSISKPTTTTEFSGLVAELQVLAKESDKLRCGLDRLLARAEEAATTGASPTFFNSGTTLATVQEAAKDRCDKPTGPLTPQSCPQQPLIQPLDTFPEALCHPRSACGISSVHGSSNTQHLSAAAEIQHNTVNAKQGPLSRLNGEAHASAEMTTVAAGFDTLPAHTAQEAAQQAGGLNSLAEELSRLGKGLNRLLMLAEAGHLNLASTRENHMCTSKSVPLSRAAAVCSICNNGEGAGVKKAGAEVLQMQQRLLGAVQEPLEEVHGREKQHLFSAGLTEILEGQSAHSHAHCERVCALAVASAITASTPAVDEDMKALAPSCRAEQNGEQLLASMGSGKLSPAGWAAAESSTTGCSNRMGRAALADTRGDCPSHADHRHVGVLGSGCESKSKRDGGLTGGSGDGGAGCGGGILLAAPGQNVSAMLPHPSRMPLARGPDSSPACQPGGRSGREWRCGGDGGQGIGAMEVCASDTSERRWPGTAGQQQSLMAPTDLPPRYAEPKQVSAGWRGGPGPGGHGGPTWCQLEDSLGQPPGWGISPVRAVAASPSSAVAGEDGADLAMRYCV